MIIPSRTSRTLTGLTLIGLLSVTGCTASEPPAPDAAETDEQSGSAVILSEADASQRKVFAGSAAQASLAMSRALYESSPVAVVLSEGTGVDAVPPEPGFGPAASAAVGLEVPLLVIGADGAGVSDVTAELDRLGVETVIGYGDPAADWPALTQSRELLAGPIAIEGFSSVMGLNAVPVEVETSDLVSAVTALESGELELLETAPPESPQPETTQPGPSAEPVPAVSAPAGSTPAAADLVEQATTDELPEFGSPAQDAAALVLATAASDPASLATARAAGADVRILADGDPRATSASVEAVAEHPDSAVYAIGEDFGDEADFAAHIEVAASGVELPGGGQTVFPGRRMVALYGHPDGPYLGALGEQDSEAAMVRVKELAAQYQPFSDEPVVPAIDLIATVASADAGADGDYSSETAIEDLLPWVDAAEDAGVYVVLDLQSGRTDFLSQAKRYEELLKRPTVGLALDPEWRLAPGQLPLQQIGTVDAEEINTVSAWLADLTRDNALPQKVMMVHQFRVDMISGRENLDTSRSELAFTLHADGHGTPEEKLNTWSVLQDYMPEGIWPSWKNFYDEDKPTLTPEQTYTVVEPKPWLVTYQ
ncbi:hypothetical protein E8P82_01820 [Arthrobacter echini]|uniref:Cell wall-binding repeat-containing protein n=1 Tax=Arthrobacter echini TaxID=1529066 RepID=A0A4S5EAN7_9MICC|nr:hypothetical protein [Arthrobacter echini]THJ68663.1 hypothetical protein E8P82_01820 [Arthrobacter echini]